MGTHGLYGFIYKGKLYLAYTHYDGYLEGLGADIIRELQYCIDNGLLAKLIEMVEALQIVTEEDAKFEGVRSSNPTSEEIQKLKFWTRRHCFGGRDDVWEGETTWYWLLNGTQGSFVETLASGYFLTLCDPNMKVTKKSVLELANNRDSSYAYIVNLDKSTFTAYCNSDEDCDGRRRKYKYNFDSLPKGFAGSDPNKTVADMGKIRYDEQGNTVFGPRRPLILPTL